MTLAEALRGAVARLRMTGVETPERDARALLMGASGLDAARLIAEPERELGAAQAQLFDTMLERRAAREPVARILGRRAFHGLDFAITQDVLDPRADSETLVEAALDHLPQGASDGNDVRILDLGTGSGCLLLALLSRLPRASGLGVDASPPALEVARRNASALDLAERADFLHSDWLEKVDGTFDLVVCNPPYLRIDEAASLDAEVRVWDPPQALFAGMDGLEAYRQIAGSLSKVLSKTGTAVFELGAGQAGAVAQLLVAAGFVIGDIRLDLAGVERCVVVRRQA